MTDVIENSSGPGHAQLILHSIRASFPASFAERIAGDDHRSHRAQLGRSGEFCPGRKCGEERAEALHPALDERRSFSIRNFRYETGAPDWRDIPADLDLSAGNAGLRADAEHGSTPRQGFGHPFDEDGIDVKENKVTEGDFFATIYKALGVDPEAENYAGVRPIPLAPFGSKDVEGLLA